jgi:hypothetical protein
LLQIALNQGHTLARLSTNLCIHGDAWQGAQHARARAQHHRVTDRQDVRVDGHRQAHGSRCTCTTLWLCRWRAGASGHYRAWRGDCWLGRALARKTLHHINATQQQQPKHQKPRAPLSEGRPLPGAESQCALHPAVRYLGCNCGINQALAQYPRAWCAITFKEYKQWPVPKVDGVGAGAQPLHQCHASTPWPGRTVWWRQICAS